MVEMDDRLVVDLELVELEGARSSSAISPAAFEEEPPGPELGGRRA
jgi:hypothetical protein